MGKVVVANHVTLDGVMQAPGRPDEDTRGGFSAGGWAVPYADQATVQKMGERMGPDHAFLFGRRTYGQLLESWNAQGGPFKEALNNTPKYVASGNPATSSSGQIQSSCTATFPLPYRSSGRPPPRIL